ncbi:MAG: ABC transporter substrate-binding protein [Candidatus Rokubacteria bacterium]|nr:ABC transporter substrate-binding protein [Candidatus Rokubacteria bacterium]
MERALAAWLLLAVGAASLPGPTEAVRGAVEQLRAVVQDSGPAGPAAEQRRQEIRRIATRLFDFPEMARRALARHWSSRTPQEREEFVRLFTDLLERSYLVKIENYSWERIVYTGETVDGQFATVRSRIVRGQRDEIPVDYRLHLVGSRWAVYDVLVEGVSFVSIYRAQFNRVIQTASYEGLVEKMRALEPSGLELSAHKP